jgi:hypothetical protein
MPRSLTLCILACGLAAADAVTVRVESMAFPTAIAEKTVRRGSPEDGSGFYPRGAWREETRTVEVVKLSNGLVEAWIVPAWGARLIRAIDLETKADYFWWTGKAKANLGWDAPGGVKPSFPFFEHGTHLDQPASWRVVEGADGSRTVAMDLRFTQYAQERERQRYGRFSDEALDVMVTLSPGSTVVRWRQRKENLAPLPRAERMWNDTLFPIQRPVTRQQVVNPKTKVAEEKEVEDRAAMQALNRIIYPVRYVTDHGPTTVHSSPHWTNPGNWDVSHFAIDAPWHFAGVFDVPSRTSRLRINDEQGPAAKLFSGWWAPFIEHWGGVGQVFERPGRLLPAWQPVEFTHRFWIAQGIGEVSYANDDAAVHVEGGRFELLTSRARNVSVNGAPAAPVGPHTVLTGAFDGKILKVVDAAGTVLLDQRFPLDRPVPAKDEVIPPEVKQKYDAIVASGGPEGETVATNEGAQGALDGIATNPRVAYRFGQFDTALRLLGEDHAPEADYLRGLIAWERDGKPDFGTATWQADYHRALQAVQAKDMKTAVAKAESYIAAVPTAWYPRLARACWARDAAAAKTLAAENPASPEAQLVLKLLGLPHELDKLLAGNAEAAKHVALFEAQLTTGAWQHPTRYPVPADKLPKAK